VPNNDFTLNVAIGKPEIAGIDPQVSGLVRILVPLEPEPTNEWLQVFAQGPPGVSYSASMHPPQIVERNEVMLRCPDNEIERYVTNLRERVEGTNSYYNREVAPELKRRREAQDAAQVEDERRLDEARKRLEDL
jgi:hypothetical protein